MSDAYIYDHVRTPRGKCKKDGSLHQASPVWLLSTLLRAMQQRNDLDTGLVDDVVLGCVTPVGEQGADIARTAVLDADWAQTVAGVTQSRFCASGLESVNLAAAKVARGRGKLEPTFQTDTNQKVGCLGVDASLPQCSTCQIRVCKVLPAARS